MLSFFKHGNKILWLLAVLVILLVIGNLYSLFFHPTVVQSNSNLPILLSFALIIGGLLVYLIMQKKRNNNQSVAVQENSHTIIESMKKVFKIVSAEGVLKEIFEFKEKKNILELFDSTKKAIVIVEAKVMMGYDFAKCVWETNEETKTVKIVQFPEAEILSNEMDYQYYNLENGLFNRFVKNDLTYIQDKGKKQIEEAIQKSELKKLAAEQMHSILLEVLQSKNWKLSGSEKILLPALKNSTDKPE